MTIGDAEQTMLPFRSGFCSNGCSMNVDLGIWDTLRRIVVGLLFLAALSLVVVCYGPLVQNNERVRRENMRLEQLIRQKEEQVKQQESAIRAIRTDPRAVERLGREKFGYIKPGETRIQFDPPVTNSPARH